MTGPQTAYLARLNQQIATKTQLFYCQIRYRYRRCSGRDIADQLDNLWEEWSGVGGSLSLNSIHTRSQKTIFFRRILKVVLSLSTRSSFRSHLGKKLKSVAITAASSSVLRFPKIVRARAELPLPFRSPSAKDDSFLPDAKLSCTTSDTLSPQLVKIDHLPSSYL